MDDLYKQTHKLRPGPHRIDEEGLKHFRNVLPNGKGFSFSFEKTTNDYGMDGELQVFINEVHTGEFFKVQLKSQNESKYNKDKTIASLTIDLKTAYFLMEEAKTPTALILIDNNAEKVFWYPIQTSATSRAQLDQALRKRSVKNPTITLSIATENQLTADDYEPLYAYFKEAATYLAQKETLKATVNKTLGEGLKHLGELQESTLALEGFDYSIRSHDDLPHQQTMFSMDIIDGKVVDYYPGSDFKPHHAPKLQITTKFLSGKEDDEAGAFKRLLEQGRGTVTLDPANIDRFEMTSGNKIIESGKNIKEGIRLTLRPSNEKQRITLSINNGREELIHSAFSWIAEGSLHIESAPGQPLSLTTKIDIGTGRNIAKLNTKVVNTSLTSVSQELRYLDFLRNRKEITISAIDQDGFKRKLFSGTDNTRLVNEDGYRLITALKEVEDTTKIQIPYPLPSDITREQLSDIYWAHRLVTGNKINTPIAIRFKSENIPDEQLKVGGALGLYQKQPTITVFDKPYVLSDFTQEIKGIISKLTLENNEYNVKLDAAEITMNHT